MTVAKLSFVLGDVVLSALVGPVELVVDAEQRGCDAIMLCV